MVSPVVCPKQPLTRDLDVQITISRPLTEIATDLTLICFLTPDTPFPPNNSRIRYYSTMEALEGDFSPETEAWHAGQAFFSRQVRPTRMSVGAVFENPVPATLLAGPTSLDDLKLITDGSLAITINDQLLEVTGLNFADIDDLDDVVTILDNAFADSATVSLEYDSFTLASVSAGDGQTIEYPGIPSSGTDCAPALGITQEKGVQIWQGYTPKGLIEEAKFVADSAKCAGSAVYGWVVDKKYRDTDEQKEFADWAEARTPAYFSSCTNSILAYNTADVTNITYYIQNKGYKRTSVIYHDNASVYPDMSYIAYALATNYSLPDSAITMKFKQLEGIEPSVITETQLTNLESRNCNVYVAVGNTARTIREGVQGADTWYTDTLVNLDNFREELQVEVYNVFLRNKKVPYTSSGQDKLVSACKKICAKYKRNGVFADRDIEDLSVETGFITAPATTITPVPVAFATTSERVSRVAPPINILAYEAGAFHKVAINVEVLN